MSFGSWLAGVRARVVILAALMAAVGVGLAPAASAQTPSVVSISPVDNTHAATSTQIVSTVYSETVQQASVTPATYPVWGSFRGLLPGSTGSVGDNVTFSVNTDYAFLPGEVIRVTATTGIRAQSSGNGALVPTVFQFRARTYGGSSFRDSGLRLGPTSRSQAADLGDLDNDGDLDVVVANEGGANEVWLNNYAGSGALTFTLTQSFGAADSFDVALGDVDNDGDLDVFFANGGAAPTNELWLNNGMGTFTQDLTVDVGAQITRAAEFADLDGDGALDIVMANEDPPHLIAWNDGSGGYVSQPIEQTAPAAYPAGSITVPLPSSLVDGETFTLDDGWHAPVVFELDFNAAVIPGNRRVDLAAALTAVDVANAIRSAVNLVGATLRIDATGTTATVTLTNEFRGTMGNQLITETVTDAGFAVIGMSGGTDLSPGVMVAGYSLTVADFETENITNEDTDFVIGHNGTVAPGYVFTTFVNNSAGEFGATSTSGAYWARSLDSGDLNADGLADLVVGQIGNSKANRVWRNTGGATFTDSSQALYNKDTYGIRLADLDGDGDLDIFGVNSTGSTTPEPNEVWFNDGTGYYGGTTPALLVGSSVSRGLALGDLDDDGDLDAFEANIGTFPDNNVWLNNTLPQVVTNTTLTVNEGGNGTVTSARLNATDVDDLENALEYVMTQLPVNGTLARSGTPLGLGARFSQADVNGGLVVYTHNGSETNSDLFRFRVEDPNGGSTAVTTFNITVNAVNDAPVVAVNQGATVAEAGTVTILNSMLSATDADDHNPPGLNNPTALTYTVTTAPLRGEVRRQGTLTTSFTQDDLNNNRITYVHLGSEQTTDSFTFSVQDDSLPPATVTGQVFNLSITPVNDPPAIGNNTGRTVLEGGSGGITSAMLSATDPDNTAAEIIFVVSTLPVNGTLANGAIALTTSNNTFTYQDVLSGLITYSHNGGETTADAFVFYARNNPTGQSSSATFNIVVTPQNDTPVVAINIGASVQEGQSVVIGNTRLRATDADVPAQTLTYSLTALPVNGSLRLNTTVLILSSTFTQADIDAGNFNYLHNGTQTTTDGFSFRVSDGSAQTSIATFSITIGAVNNPPVIGPNGGATLNEGATVFVTSAMLGATDPDDVAGTLTFVITALPVNGTLRNGATAIPVGGTFLQTALSAGNVISYEHSGGETTIDSFQFYVRDPTGLTSGLDTFIFTVNAINDLPVILANTGLTLQEGATVVVGNTALRASDAETASAALLFRITQLPTNGTLRNDVTGLVVGSLVPQADVVAGKLTYQHDGGEVFADSFKFVVRDGAGDETTPPDTFSFTVTAVNDAPAISTNTGASVNEGASVAINSSRLAASDPDNPADERVFVVTTLPANGSLLNGATALTTSNNTFSFQDVLNGVISYVHNGGETTADSFVVYVRNSPSGQSAAVTFGITVTAQNDMPVVVTNAGLTVQEGGSGGIGNGRLRATDSDLPAQTLTYSLTVLPVNGVLRLGGTVLTLASTFTQDQIDVGSLSYEHNDSQTTSDSFTFRVGDGVATTGTATFAIVVTAVNDAPVVSTNTGSSLNEGATRFITSAMLNATDADDAASTLTFTVTALPSNGTLRNGATAIALGGTFPQTALVAGNVISYEHNSGETTSDSFQVVVRDPGNLPSSAATFILTVVPQNDPPVVATNAGLAVNEGANGVIGNTRLRATDADLPAQTLTYSLTALPVNGTLRIGTTALTLSSTFTQSEIDAGSLNYQHNGSQTVTDSFSFRVSDGVAQVGPAVFAISITEINNPPVVGPNTGTTLNEGATRYLTSAMLDASDPDHAADTLTFVVTALPVNGTLRNGATAIVVGGTFPRTALVAGNVISYEHSGSETTSDSLQLQVRDPAGASSSTATFIFTVTAQNDLPVIATNAGLTVAEAGNGVIGNARLRATDSDLPAQTLTFSLTALPVNGDLRLGASPLLLTSTFTQADIDSGALNYQHNGSQTTTDSFTFRVSDGVAQLAPAIFAITIGATNDPPVVAVNTGATLNEGATRFITSAMLAATDPDNTADSLTFVVNAIPVNGTLRNGATAIGVGGTFAQTAITAGNVISYEHNGGETTSDSFQFLVRDPAGLASATATFLLTVTAVNDLPVITANVGASLQEGGQVVVTNAALRATDAETAADALLFRVTQVPAYGQLADDATVLVVNSTFSQANVLAGKITFTHNGSENFADSFRFVVRDGAGGETTPAATFNLTIAPVNDVPDVVTNTGATVAEAGQVTITNAMLAIADPDHTTLQRFFVVDLVPVNGQLLNGSSPIGAGASFTQADVDTSKISYRHLGGENTSDSFRFTARDAANAQASAETFSITITPVNDLPVITVNTGLSLAEGANAIIGNNRLQATDADNPAAQLTFTVTALPTNGALRIGTTPLALNGTFTQVQIDANALNYQHDGSQTTSDSFLFRVSDGTAQIAEAVFAITVSAVNNSPSVVTNTGLTLAEGATANIGAARLAATDPDDAEPSLVYVLLAVPINGTLRNGVATLAVSSTFTQADLDAGNRISYEHSGSETTSDSFRFVVRDPGGLSSTAETFVITVTAVNDPPQVVANLGMTLNEGAAGTINSAALRATDNDHASAGLLYRVSVIPSYGSLRLDGVALAANGTFTQGDIDTGKITYLHAGTENLADSFYFTVSDGSATTASQAFTITISPINDAPVVLANLGLIVDEGMQQVITDTELSASDVDNLPASLTYVLVQAPTVGTLRNGTTPIGGNGTFTQGDINSGNINYLHSGSETILDTFQFVVRDAGGASAPTGTFTITIVPVNDPPVVVNNLGLTLAEAASANILASRLQVTDNDDLASDLVFRLTVPPASGSLTLAGVPLAANATFTQDDINDAILAYAHNGSETVADTFRFTVTDGQALTSERTFALTITPVNDVPEIAVNAGLTLPENSSAVITPALLAATDPDADPTTLRFTVLVLPTRGTLRLGGAAIVLNGTFLQSDVVGGQVTYTNSEVLPTTDTFRFNVTDGTATSTSANFNIVISSTNDAPTVTVAGPATVDEAGAVTLGSTLLAANDVDNDPASLVYSITAAPLNGALYNNIQPLAVGSVFTQDQVNRGRIRYVHSGGENTSDQFSFRVADSAGAFALGDFDIVVTPVNDLPVVTINTLLTINEGATAQITSSMLAATDTEVSPGNAGLVFRVVGLPANGNLTVGGVPLAFNGTFTQANLQTPSAVRYVHSSSETTDDSFSFVITDGTDTTSPQFFQIVINPVNDAPVIARNVILYVTEGLTVLVDNGSLRATDSDDDDALLLFTLTAAPTHGELLLNNVALAQTDAFTQGDINSAGLTYRNDGGEAGGDTFSIRVADPQGLVTPVSGSVVVNVSVRAVNDAPVVVANTGATVAARQTVTITSTMLRAQDADNDDAALIYTITQVPQHGRLRNNITTVQAGQRVLQGDIDSNRLVYIHNGDEATADSFSFRVRDPANFELVEMVFAVTIQGVNDAPSIVQNAGRTIEEGAAFTLNSTLLRATDPDSDNAALVYTLQVPPAHGSLLLNAVAVAANGNFTQGDIDGGRVGYQHDGSESTADAFTVVVADNLGATSTPASFAITVNAVNDAPTLVNNGLSVNEGARVVISLAALSAQDVDSDVPSLVFTLVTGPTYGTLFAGLAPVTAGNTFSQSTISSSNLAYLHDGGESTSDSFVFKVRDSGNAETGETTFTLTVLPINDLPVVGTIADQSIMTGSTFATFDLDDVVTDADNAVADLLWTVTGNTNLNITVSVDHVVTVIEGTAGWVGSETVTFTVTDGAATASTTATFAVTAAPNRAPTLVDPTPSGTLTAVVGQELTFTAVAEDPDGDTLSYRIEDLPVGASFDEDTGVFAWTPLATHIGDWEMTLFAEDLTLSDSRGLVITVVPAPLPDAGTPDAGPIVEEGCGCRVSQSRSPGLLAAFALLGILIRRRRAR